MYKFNEVRMIGSGTKAYADILEALKEILEGVSVCIDPSIGSTSSQPGWAVLRKGDLTESGTFEIPAHLSIPDRLHRLNSHVRKLYNRVSPDVLIYEEIPPQWQGGGGNATGHASLLKAVGAILAVPGPDKYVGILPVSWKKMARPEYVKGDEADAIEIGHVVVTAAKHIIETNEKARRRLGGKGK